MRTIYITVFLILILAFLFIPELKYLWGILALIFIILGAVWENAEEKDKQ